MLHSFYVHLHAHGVTTDVVRRHLLTAVMDGFGDVASSAIVGELTLASLEQLRAEFNRVPDPLSAEHLALLQEIKKHNDRGKFYIWKPKTCARLAVRGFLYQARATGTSKLGYRLTDQGRALLANT